MTQAADRRDRPEYKLAAVENNLGRMPDLDTPKWNERRERYERVLPVLRSAIAENLSA